MIITERFTEILVDHPKKIILSDKNGAYTTSHLYNATQYILSEELHGQSYKGKRIAVLCNPGLSYVSAMLGGWMSGAMMVPMCVTHPQAELQHVLDDAQPALIIADKELKAQLPPTRIRIITPDFQDAIKEPVPANYTTPLESDPALMLYTSGTTGKPKGVVHTHASLRAQIECLVAAWAWTEDDRILHFLPLHHTHGIVNKWLCAMWSGARCDMIEKFDAAEVIDRISKEDYTLFMAVPTVYAKMIEALSPLDSARDDKDKDDSARDDKDKDDSARDDKDKDDSARDNKDDSGGDVNFDTASSLGRPEIPESANEAATRSDNELWTKFRLMVSGSAALPVPVLEKWKALTGHFLLERYGMTETGMVLSNPLKGERRAGSVGQVLPGMQVRMVNEAGEIAVQEGELQVKGRNLFSGYWNKEEETKKSFTKDKWFRTGDLVRLKDGYYYIVGRLSTDIIKSGGYKISALEIESVLLQHPEIKECAVVGLPDETWGEKIAAAVVWESEPITLEELREWLKDKLAVYKLPSVMKNCGSLPRNAMGKTEKGKVKAELSDGNT